MLTTLKNMPALNEISESGIPQLIERIFTDQHGRQFRMVFMVAVVGGELKGRLVSVQQLSVRPRLAGSTSSYDVICLPIECSNKKGSTEYVFDFAPVVSPYVSLESLLVSQPTRAPSKYR